MADGNRDVFLTLLIVHLADVKARLEVSMRTQAAILEQMTKRPLDEILGVMKSEYAEARKLHEAGMLQDVQAIAEGHTWPPPDLEHN